MTGGHRSGRQSPLGLRLFRGWFTSVWVMVAGVLFWGAVAVIAASRGVWAVFGVALVLWVAGLAMVAVQLTIGAKATRGYNAPGESWASGTALDIGKAAVVVRRPPSAKGAAIKFPIWIDGEKVGAVAFGETRLFEVDPGDHRVGVCGRRPPHADHESAVRLSEGEVRTFECRREVFEAVRLVPIT